METVRFGIIGCGGFARYRLSKLLSIKEAQVVALADPDQSQIEATIEAHASLAAQPSFEDFREMIRKVPMDAIAIATPHTLHFEQIIASLEAGLHVICEKPLVTSVEQAHKVIAARDKARKVAMVSYQRHLQPEFRYVRERISSGEFGPVQMVQALQCQEWKRLTAGTWRQDPKLSGGGQLNDSGSHFLDILLWITGLKPESVSAMCDFRDTPVDINSTLNIKFKGGALGNISICGDAQHWHEDTTIWCDKGAFFLRNGKLSVSDELGNRFESTSLPGGSHPDQNFVDAILGRGEIQSPFECGLEVIRLTEAAWRSSDQGGSPVQV